MGHKHPNLFAILLLVLISTYICIFPNETEAIQPFTDIETFSYNNDISPAPNWIVENTECNDVVGCSSISDIFNNDGSLAKWIVNDGWYKLHITPHSPLSFTRSLPSNWPENLKDYSISFDIYLL